MEHSISPLTLQLLEWVAAQPRTYAEAMEAWRSHCPRHTIWEDALADGLVKIEGGFSRESPVKLTAKGRTVLDEGR